MKGDNGFFLFFVAFLVFIMFIFGAGGFPEAAKFMDSTDLIWISGGLLGITGACVLATGVPCAASIIIWGILGFWNYLFVNVDWVKLVIFTPLVLGLVYEFMMLARGNSNG